MVVQQQALVPILVAQRLILSTIADGIVLVTAISTHLATSM